MALNETFLGRIGQSDARVNLRYTGLLFRVTHREGAKGNMSRLKLSTAAKLSL